MSKRAAGSEATQNEVFDLQEDARWQARLEDARARRAEALKKQGRSDKVTRSPRKPWEEEASEKPDLRVRQRPDDHDGLDFHDRMNALRKFIKADEDDKPRAEAPPREKREDTRLRNWSPEAESDIVQDATDQKEQVTQDATPPARDPNFKEPPKVRVDDFFSDPEFERATQRGSEPREVTPSEAYSLLVDPLPPRREEPTSRPWQVKEEQQESGSVDDEPVVDTTKSKPKRAGGMPFSLTISILVFAALPFFAWLPPIERGPDPTLSPTFGLEPALGITAAMAEFPTPTGPGDQNGRERATPGRPLQIALTPAPAFSRAMPVLSDPVASQPSNAPAFSRAQDSELKDPARDAPTALVASPLTLEITLGGPGAVPAGLSALGLDEITPRPRP